MEKGSSFVPNPGLPKGFQVEGPKKESDAMPSDLPHGHTAEALFHQEEKRYHRPLF